MINIIKTLNENEKIIVWRHCKLLRINSINTIINKKLTLNNRLTKAKYLIITSTQNFWTIRK